MIDILMDMKNDGIAAFAIVRVFQDERSLFFNLTSDHATNCRAAYRSDGAAIGQN